MQISTLQMSVYKGCASDEKERKVYAVRRHNGDLCARSSLGSPDECMPRLHIQYVYQGKHVEEKSAMPQNLTLSCLLEQQTLRQALTSRVGSYRNLTGTVRRSGSTKGRNTRVSMNQLIHFSTPGRNVMSPPYTLMLKLNEGISTRDICRAAHACREDAAQLWTQTQRMGHVACIHVDDEAE